MNVKSICIHIVGSEVKPQLKTEVTIWSLPVVHVAHLRGEDRWL
jgi:hypothetical protein